MKRFILAVLILSACEGKDRLKLTQSTGILEIQAFTKYDKELFVASTLDGRKLHAMAVSDSSYVYRYAVRGEADKFTLSFGDSQDFFTGQGFSKVLINNTRFCNWQGSDLVIDLSVKDVCERKDGMLATAEERWGPLTPETYNSITAAVKAGRMDWMTRDIEIGSFPSEVEQMRQLKTDAPGLKVACYVNPRELMSNPARPWQYAIWSDLNTNHPDYFMYWSDGSRVVSYTSPDGSFNMTMLNLMEPAVREYLAGKIAEFVKASTFGGVCDELHFDNQATVIMWMVDYIGQGRQITDHSGKAMSRWEFEYKWNDALVAFNQLAWDKTHLGISGRAKDQVVLESKTISRVFFERAMKSDIPPNSIFGGIMQARLIAKNGACVFHHDVNQLLNSNTLQPIQPDTFEADSRQAEEDGYAGDLMTEGCAFNFNLYGDWQNGGWVYHPDVVIDVGGQCEVELPYDVRYRHDGIQTLTGGLTFDSFDAMRGDLMFFWRRIIGGTEGTSHLTDLNGAYDDGRWAAGLWASTLNGGTTQVGFTGPGTLTSEDFIAFDAANLYAKGYFHAVCPLAEAWVNVEAKVKTVTGLDGKQYTLQPAGVIGFGKVVKR